MLAQLERDCRPDDLFLPFEGYMQAAHPMLPVAGCCRFRTTDFAADVADEGFIGAKKEVLITLDPVTAAFKHIPDWRISRQAQCLRTD